jgi:hypothetical protein
VSLLKSKSEPELDFHSISPLGSQSIQRLTISNLMGHSSIITTMVYLHVRRQHFDRSPSPLDWLPVRQCPPTKTKSISGRDPNVHPANPNATGCTSRVRIV